MKTIGILGINKPSGMTSFDVIRVIKRKTGIKKIGHGGTLDPMATGVLPILLNEGTSFFDALLASPKIYKAEIQLGAFTDTDDKEGSIIQTLPVPDISLEMIIKSAKDFTGTISQIPPQYSALKVDGKRAYDLARAGEKVELKAREVNVYSWSDVSYDNDKKVITVTISCGSGTYIRSLARDLAETLQTGGHLISLHRIKSGGIHIDDTITLEELSENWEDFIISPEVALSNIDTIKWMGDLKHLQHGKPLLRELYKKPDKEGLHCLTFHNKVVALVHYEKNKLHYKKNLSHLFIFEDKVKDEE